MKSFSVYQKNRSLFLLVLLLAVSPRIFSKADSVKVWSLIRESQHLLYDDRDKAYEYIYRAKSLLNEVESEKLKADIWYHIADLHEVYYVMDSCDYYVSKAIPVYQKESDHRMQMFSHNMKGNNFNHMKNFPAALKHFLIAQDLARKINDNGMLAGIYNNIGNVYQNQADQFRAIEYYKKAVEMNKKTGNESWLNANYGNLSQAYSELKKRDEALAFARKAYQIIRKPENQNEYEEANDLGNLSLRFNEMNQVDSARYYLRKALKMYEKTQNEEGVARSQANWAELLMKTDPDSALFYAKLSLKGGQALKSLNILESAYGSLAEIYRNKGDFKNAFFHFEQYVKIKDSTLNADYIAQTAGMESAFKYTQQQKSDSLQHVQEKFEQEVTNRQKEERQAYIRYSLLVVIVLLTGFGIYVFVNFRRKAKLSKLIQAQKELVEEKQKEIIDSINYAQRLQSAILADEGEIKKYFPESFLLYKPKDIVAGDFYFFETTATHVFYAAADCTGHGVPGAMVSMVCSNALTRCVKEFGLTDPGKILDRARELVLETFRKSSRDVKDGMDISLISLKFKDQSLKQNTTPDSQNPHHLKHETLNIELQWAGAHNPLWYIRQGEIKEVAPDKQPIGLSEMPKPFTTHRLSLQTDDLVILFTDGFADQFGGEKGKKLKYSTFKKLITEKLHAPIPEQLAFLDQSFLQWKGEYEQTDDVCVIGIKL